MLSATWSPASRCVVRFVLLTLLAFVLASAPLPAQEAAPPANRWEETIRRFEEEDATQPPSPGGVVFVGSSSIRLWDLKASFPELNAVNRGFGGSQLADAVHFADRIVLPYQPRLVVLYAGDNDLAAGKTPEQVVEDYRRFVSKVHAKAPATRIAYIAIKPSISRWRLVEQVRKANQAIAEMARDDERLEFVDIDAPMIGADGKPRPELFRPDGLHLNAEGYQVWTEKLRPVLEK